jgi:hypothetical protein
LVIVITVVTPGPVPAEPPPPRLRLTDPCLQPIVQEGRAHSPSFRALLERVERTDVVVYVECTQLPSHLDGQLMFLTKAAGIRYVLVRIAWDRPLIRKVAILGHELQHALEVAANPDISSSETMAAAYERFGFARRTTERTDFDTVAAIITGQRVWRELIERADGD